MHRSIVATLFVLAGTAWISTAFAEPVITSINPTSGFKTGGGKTLTINGTAFGASGNSATIGGAVCAISAEGPQSIECRVPEGSGTKSILVVDDLGLASQPFPLTYDPPAVSSVTPSHGPTLGGVPITIFGDGFGPNGVARSILVGSAECPLEGGVPTSHTELRCTLPPGVGHDLAVAVGVDGQPSSADGTFSYDPPSITSVTPTSGPSAGGLRLTINGLNFGAQQATATVGGAICSGAFQTDSRIECTLPPGSGTNVDVEVTVGGQTSDPVSFSYAVHASACDAAKWKAAGGFAACLAKAEAKAAKAGVDPNADPKIAKALLTCSDKFSAACTKAETKLTDCSQGHSCDAVSVVVRGWDPETKQHIQ